MLGSLGFSHQKPDKRAIERNKDVVRTWKRSKWPILVEERSGVELQLQLAVQLNPASGTAAARNDKGLSSFQS